jgi:nitric oxide reductase NorE protein
MFERARDVEIFNQSANTMHTTLGMINTLLLLTSSLFVAIGVRALRERIKPELARILFLGALICGFGFVVIKYFEYSDLVRAGFYPAANLFYMYYYVLTGIHLTHLLAGMCALLYMWRVSSKGFCRPDEIGGIENGASFWHAVDLLWIVLFPLLYLVR